jgi:hypothetical protein
MNFSQIYSRLGVSREYFINKIVITLKVKLLLQRDEFFTDLLTDQLFSKEYFINKIANCKVNCYCKGMNFFHRLLADYLFQRSISLKDNKLYKQLILSDK